MSSNHLQKNGGVAWLCLLPAILCSLCIGLVFHQTVHAGGIVASATDADLRAALAGGGTVTFAVDGTIVLTNVLAITSDTVIDGTGHTITISGNDAVRVFQVNSGAQLTMTNIGVANGFAVPDGAAVDNSGTAFFVDCTFSGNRGIGQNSGQSVMAGAIRSPGTLTVLGCSFLNNMSLATNGGSVSLGAAIGGGVDESHGSYAITNCTFYGQNTNCIACSIMSPGKGPVYIVNCAFATNGGVAIINSQYSWEVVVQNTVFSGSPIRLTGFGNDNIVDAGHNLSSDGSGHFTNLFSLENIDPLLGPLADNGGPTLTLLPQAASPLIDGGSNSNAPAFDQRGIARPQGAAVDIGAVESQTAGTYPGTFRFTVTTNNVTETNTLLYFTVLRVGGTGTASVDFATVNGTATGGQDFVTTNGTLNFAANQRSNTFAIQLLDDSEVEPVQSFTVELNNATAGAIIYHGTNHVFITDNDPGVSFSTANFNSGESAGTATITVIRTGNTDGTSSVNFATADDTAGAGSDYVGTSGSVTFSPGQTNASFTVIIKDDGLSETDETVVLTLSGPTGAALGTPATATLTIVDDDAVAAGSIHFNRDSYGIGEASGQALIGVSRTGGSNVAATIDFATADGTATAGSDYTATSGTLTFNPGETMKYLAVPILNNSPVEGDETVNLTLSNPVGGASLTSPSAAVLTISDGSQSPATSDESGLRTAVDAGGQVVLANDGTIVLASPLVISKPVQIDANGHDVTLSGSNLSQLFIVQPGVTLDLRGVTLANGFVIATTGNPAAGGAISNSGGQVFLLNCSLLNNTVQGGPSASSYASPAGNALGGAIYSSGGLVWASNTVFTANTAKGGQGQGDGKSGNAYGGALYLTEAVGILADCQFSINVSTSPIPSVSISPYAPGGLTRGGAIYQFNSDLSIQGGSFGSNSASGGDCYRQDRPGPGQGGAIYSESPLAIAGSVFIGNTALGGKNGVQGTNGEGGALYLTQPAEISDTLFAGNIARGAQGYIYGFDPYPGGRGSGGSIYNSDALTLNGCAFATNQAVGADGILTHSPTPGQQGAGAGVFNSGMLMITNCTFAGNKSLGGNYSSSSGSPNPLTAGGNGLGGGVCNHGGSVRIVYSTFGNNSAIGGLGSSNGVALGGAIQNSNGPVILTGTIVANSPSGGNVSGPVTDLGYNLSSDASAAFSGTGSLNNTNPVLGPLEFYGGTTPTMALLAGSPAINAGNNADSPAVDQRGRARPFDANSDIGAFESSPPYSVVGTVSGKTLQQATTVWADAQSTGPTGPGSYHLNDLTPGTYTVFPSNETHVYFPASRLITVGPDQAGVDFTAYSWNHLETVSASASGLHYIFAGTNGLDYRLLMSTNLSVYDWSPVLTNSIGPSNLTHFFRSIDPNSPRQFFRTVYP